MSVALENLRVAVKRLDTAISGGFDSRTLVFLTAEATRAMCILQLESGEEIVKLSIDLTGKLNLLNRMVESLKGGST